MSTQYYYDCEFLEDGRTIELISIGIASSDGREYYAVNSDMDASDIYHHEWLRENVLPYLPVVNIHSAQLVVFDRKSPELKPHWIIANEVRDFLTVNSDNWRDNQLWANYGAYDHVALCQLWGTMMQLPKGVPMFTRELQQLWWDAGCPVKPPQPTEDHHALADARWNKELWEVCQSSLENSQKTLS